jgi:hypothetical protein
MTRQTLIAALRELSGNRYFLAQDLANPEGFHVSFDDLNSIKDQRKLTKLMKSLNGKFDVTDKGIWFPY